jgi:alpha-N-arabinofuranosidase
MVHTVDASAILDGDRLQVFLTNRDTLEAAPVSVVLADRRIASCESAELLTGPDPKAANTFERKDVVAARPFEGVEVRGDRARCTLPPLSFAAITLILRDTAGIEAGNAG